MLKVKRQLPVTTGIFCILFMLAPAVYCWSGAMPVDIGFNSGDTDYTPEQVLQLGEKIYRQGILPNGEVVKAFVQGDIPVDGQTFSCVRCHRRSGLGTSEGDIVTLPVNGLNLFRPRVLWDPRRRHSHPGIVAPGVRQIPAFMQARALRPSYTDNSLEKVITTGIDPSGRVLDEVMPRYELDADAMKILIYYLKNLSSSYSPGVSEDSLHFATIVTEGAKPADRQAMLSVINTYINDRNTQLRNQFKRASNGAFNRREADTSYRLLNLVIWELKGPRDSWYRQLEDYYRQQPVFAILGGISSDGWEEIHRFSEARGVPTLFPITDKPVVSASNWNTVYFSTGLYQEGETTARFIKRHENLTAETRILQIYDEAGDGAMLVRGFDETWEAMSRSGDSTNEILKTDLSLSKLSETVADNFNNLVVVLWNRLNDERLSKVLVKLHTSDVTMILSSYSH
jgi:hypothetical protein